MQFKNWKNCIKKIGRNLHNTLKKIKLNLNRNIEIGRETKVRFAKLDSYTRIGNYCNIQGGNIGSYSYIGNYTELPQTKIGKFCSIAEHVLLCAGNHPMHYVSTSPYTYSTMRWTLTEQSYFTEEFYYISPNERYLCEIGNDVWIGVGARLVCGNHALRIGDGAVIAAGGVVTKDVPAYAVVAGCPAKIVRYRFPENQIDFLLELKWWDRGATWIKQHVKYFQDIEQLMRIANNENAED